MTIIELWEQYAQYKKLSITQQITIEIQKEIIKTLQKNITR